jgi:hypothetical protein
MSLNPQETAPELLYQSRRFMVTEAMLSSRGDAHRLADVAHVRLRRPLIGAAAIICLGVTALLTVFWGETYASERIVVASVLTVILIVAVRFARLELHAIGIGAGGVIHGDYAELSNVKRAIAERLAARSSADPRRAGLVAEAFSASIPSSPS